jgi:23S rRNA (guanosine2251-2'-O)-methyltransferase
MSREREPRVVFGFHAVLARLRAEPSSVLEIYLDETRNDARAKDLAAAAERAKVHLMRVPTKRLDGFYGGGRHQGVVARVEVKSATDTLDSVLEGVDRPLLLVLDGVTDPHNLGACLRSPGCWAPKARACGASRASRAICW